MHRNFELENLEIREAHVSLNLFPINRKQECLKCGKVHNKTEESLYVFCNSAL